jgi:hypothetical protein
MSEVVKVDGRKNNRPPMVRYGAPKVGVVTMDAVPEPPPRNGSVGESLYAEISKLKPGTALKAEFENEKNAEYVRGKLRSLAKKDKQFMSSSKSADGKTRWFWLEKL